MSEEIKEITKYYYIQLIVKDTDDPNYLEDNIKVITQNVKDFVDDSYFDMVSLEVKETEI